jgi:sortase A
MGALDWWESRSAQREIAQQWDTTEPAAETPASPSDATPAPTSPIRPSHRGAAVAKLTIPRLDTVLYVVEGTDNADLKRGPGHLRGSVLPGQKGNCVIAGHRDTHFRVLRNIEKGDEILLERNGQEFRYRVDGTTVVSPDNTASLLPTRDAVLNLITCYPFQYIGSAPRRFIVHADLENAALSASN